MGPTPRLTSHRPIRSPGKSNFLKFMLAWLLLDGQVVDLPFLPWQGVRYRTMKN